MKRELRGWAFVVAVSTSLLACETLSARTELAMARLQGKPDPSGGQATSDTPATPLPPKASCPDAAAGRAVGAETPEAAVACFRLAISEKSTAMLLRVTCQGRTAASCKHTDATEKEADKLTQEMAKLPWDKQVGTWQESAKASVFAIDTHPGQKSVSTITVCKIAEGEKWAVCETGTIGRADAERKSAAPPR